jgi:hypothetical protein
LSGITPQSTLNVPVEFILKTTYAICLLEWDILRPPNHIYLPTSTTKSIMAPASNTLTAWSQVLPLMKKGSNQFRK